MSIVLSSIVIATTVTPLVIASAKGAWPSMDGHANEHLLP